MITQIVMIMILLNRIFNNDFIGIHGNPNDNSRRWLLTKINNTQLTNKK